MDGHDILGGLIVIVFMICFIISAQFILVDYRYFNDIEQQCASAGFIQNDKIRIICSPEKTKKAS